jgi:hypothetical protein
MRTSILIVLIFSMMTLTGCGKVSRSIANITGYSSLCINGVQYLQFASGATVAYNRDGKVVLCN